MSSSRPLAERRGSGRSRELQLRRPLDFNTSFTGKDLLRTRLRSGNFQDNTFAGTPFPATGAEIAFEEGRRFNVNRIFYQFPVGDGWTMTAGPIVRQDDMLAIWPSQYPADTVLDFFTYAGAPGAYSLNLVQVLV